MPRSPSRRVADRRTAVRLHALDQKLEPLLAEVVAAQKALTALVGDVTLDERRVAHRRLRRAYGAADAVLREATAEAKDRSRHEWMAMRRRLSALDTARQHHLMAERDDLTALPLGTVRVPPRFGDGTAAVPSRGEAPADRPPEDERGHDPVREGFVTVS